MCELNSESSVLFPWSICLSLYQYYAVFYHYCFVVQLEVTMVISPEEHTWAGPRLPGQCSRYTALSPFECPNNWFGDCLQSWCLTVKSLPQQGCPCLASVGDDAPIPADTWCIMVEIYEGGGALFQRRKERDVGTDHEVGNRRWQRLGCEKLIK